MKTILMEGINTIVTSELKKEDIVNILQNLLNKTINVISTELKIKPIINQRNISIGNVVEGFGVSYNVNRKNNIIILSDNIFTLRKTTLIQNLIFFLIKESFMHFIPYQIKEIIELFVNFTTILWIQKHFNINNFENPLIITINRNIYPQTIVGKDSIYYMCLLELLFKKNMDFIKIYNKTIELSKLDIDESKIEQHFSSWIYQETIKDEDVIAPIQIKKNKENIIDYFIRKGYEDSKTPEIAKILDKNETTIQRAVRSITAKHKIFWSPVINYEKLRLHNYFLIIKLLPDGDSKKIEEMLLNNQYLKSIYIGYSDDQNIIYSPSLISPHIIANNLKEKLLNFKNKKQITNFTLQLYNEKFVYNTLTTSKNNLLIEPSIKTYEQLLSKKSQTKFNLKKYVTSHVLRDKSPVFTDDDVLDYNLLFFLSYLNAKYLLSGSYGGWIHELPKLLEKNDKSLTRMSEAVTFISRIEQRAIRRRFLSYYLYIRNLTNKNPDVMLIESPLIDANNTIIDTLQVFGFLYQFQLHDRTIFVLPGISHKHPIKDLINNAFVNEGINTNFYTVNLLNSKFIPLHDLFDYEEQKWKI